MLNIFKIEIDRKKEIFRDEKHLTLKMDASLKGHMNGNISAESILWPFFL
jgi:hypothetical protein